MQEWWRPERFAQRRERLEQRGLMLAAVRRFFDEQEFVEVDTPALQASPGLEPHLQAFATELHDPRDGRTARRYLHTSPEFAMKKLLVAGMPRIWQLAHVFRDGERSATHHPEFAMLEWYRAGASWRDLIPDCDGLLRACQAAAGAVALAWRGARRRCPAAVARDQRRRGFRAALRHRYPGDRTRPVRSRFRSAGRGRRGGSASSRIRATIGRRSISASSSTASSRVSASARRPSFMASRPRWPHCRAATPQIRVWPSASSSMSAASSSPTPSAN